MMTGDPDPDPLDNKLVQSLVGTWCADPLDGAAVEEWVARFQAESALTDRESEWLVRWLGAQQAQSQIAEDLGLDPSTVSHLKRQTFASLAEIDRTTALLASMGEEIRPEDGEVELDD